MIRVTVYNEGLHEKTSDSVRAVYPEGIHGALKKGLESNEISVRTVTLDDLPDGLSQLLIGGRELGELLAASPQVAVVSATGSTRMGRQVAVKVAGRFGRAILELGGNNAMIVTPSADLELAARAGFNPQLTRRRDLLKHFGGLQELSRASIEEIAKAPGISKKLAESIYANLHSE